jgi:tetratricopeptide (TPR) repeat protein
MLTEDYIMRMINQMIAVLTQLIGLKNAGQYQEAQQMIDQSLEQLLGLKPDLLRNMEDESILNLLTSQGELGTERLFLLAELYRHEGDILKEQNKDLEAVLDYQRALNFYLQVAVKQADQESPQLDQKIGDLFRELEPVYLPIEILYQLFDYFESHGDIVLVDDVITKLLASPEIDTEIITDIILYYERLLESGDLDAPFAELQRSEVVDKLEKVKNWGG